jgi:hypothetical protein
VPELDIEQLPKLDAWLQSILWNATLPQINSAEGHDRKLEIHRLKAKVPFSNGDIKIVQGVREIFEILDAPKSDQDGLTNVSKPTGKIVLIGRDLVGVPFEASFESIINS